MKTQKAALTGLAVLTMLFSSAVAAQGKSKDIKIVLPSAVDVVEPCHMMTTALVGMVLRQNIVESLTKLSPKDNSVQPHLATSWQQVDPLTWRVNLRKGVKFHDGSAFNAEAVSTAVTRLLMPQLVCRDKIRLFAKSAITTKVVDEYTIDITTEQPTPLLPVTLAQIGITSPKTSMTAPTRQPVGTGPYVFTSWDPTQSLVVKRFDGYWGTKPEVEQATYIWRSEPALRASMVAVGEADIGLQIAPQDAVNAKSDFGYLNADSLRIRIIPQAAPLNDIHVRTALNLAVNRQAFIGTIVSKDVQLATQYMLPSVNGHNPALKPWGYDINKAKSLIKQAKAAGVKVDQEIILYGGDFLHANSTELLESLVQGWQQIGLNVKLKMIDKIQLSAMRRKPYAENRPPVLIHETHDNTAGDAVYTMMVYYHSSGQLSDLSNPKIDKMIEEASAASGPKRREIYQEANTYIQQQIVPDVMLYHLVSYIRVGPRLVYKPNSTTEGKIELSDIKFN
ncbi:ABC transporter substrate-binding protein [Polaromonas sp. P1(28)-13]|nr:ABC transporter substrate-binding protein [Polaromonas sp. P1(28)-13]